MRLRGLLTLAAPVLIATCADVACADMGSIYPGLVLSAGGAYSTRSHNDTVTPGVGSGLALDADYTHVILNAGVGYKGFGGGVANVYAGAGISGLLQFQAGYGTRGFVKRIRTDMNFGRLTDFLTNRRPNRYNTSLSDRLTFSAAVEQYPGNPQYDNISFGLGLLY